MNYDAETQLFSNIIWGGILTFAVVAILLFLVASKKPKDAIDQFHIGNYLGGLDANPPMPAVVCEVYPATFLFKMQFGGDVGEIPRDSIEKISVETKKHVTQRLTVTRMLALNIFALAVPKKTEHSESCLVIVWQDQKGEEKTTVFESPGGMSAVEHKLNSYKMKKVNRLKPEEKKCPYCAEIIKKEAKICRFCRSEVG